MVWETVLNVIPVFSVTLGVELTLVLDGLRIKQNEKWKFLLLFWGKILFINVIGDIILRKILGDSVEYSLFFATISFLVTLGTMYGMSKVCEDDLTKIWLTFVFGDYLAGFSVVIAEVLIGIITERKIVFNLVEKTYMQNALFFLFALLYILLWSSPFGKKITTKWRNHELKHTLFWLIFSIVNLLLAWFSSFRTAYILGTGMITYYLMFAMVIMMSIAIYIFYQKYRQKQLYIENKNLHIQQSLMAEYYNALEEQMALTEKLQQDISTYTHIIEKITKVNGISKEIMDYAIALKAQYDQIERVVYCSNLIIDSVICNKVKICEKNGITTHIDMKDFVVGSMEEIELLSILYNMFDYAIEGCMEVEAPERFIYMDSRQQEDCLMLEMKYSTVRNYQIKKTVGTGMIHDLVKKYHGECIILYEADACKICIKVKQ